MTSPAGQHLVLYDGVCGLCNRFVRFILVRDGAARFHFAAAQGDLAAGLLTARGLAPGNLEAMCVIVRRGTPDEQLLSRGRAAHFILNELGGVWGVLARGAGRLPDVILNTSYRLVASNRYRIWGRYDACPIPPPEWRDRFIA